MSLPLSLFYRFFTTFIPSGDQMALLLVTVTLSMMTTPLLMKLVDKWLSRQFNGPEEEDEKPWVNDDKPVSLSWASGVLVR